MYKHEIKYGEKLKWSNARELVTVIDVTLHGKVGILLPNGQTYEVEARELSRPVTPSAPVFAPEVPRFKVGDKVRIKVAGGTACGRAGVTNDEIGTVERVGSNGVLGINFPSYMKRYIGKLWSGDAKEMELVQPEPTPTPAVEATPEHKPSIEIIFDENIDAVFIVIDKKVTLCIPDMTQRQADAIAESSKHDDDKYNEEIGTSIAFYRSVALYRKDTPTIEEIMGML